ncbi:MAG: hypothetical protein ACYTDY_17765, partial [Planctomycetota bacterium]
MHRWELLLAGAALAFGLLLGARFVQWRVRRRLARHRRVGRTGERTALRLLDRAGYRLLATEVAATGEVVVDGEPREFLVRADALVRRRRRRYVAEFKGGAESASIANRATRRQLLEYASVF